jgi:hypothetical protein
VSSLASAPAPGAGGTNLYAGTYPGGVFLSTNGGVTWAERNFGLTNVGVFALAVAGTSLFAATNGGVFLSTNAGARWAPVNDGLSTLTTWSLAINGGDLLAGTDGGGVYRRPLSEMVTGVRNSPGEVPSSMRLEQNYPNPFNGSTTITYEVSSVSDHLPAMPAGRQAVQAGESGAGDQLPVSSRVRLAVYDMLGREVAVLVNESRPAGASRVTFDAGRLASGTYVYRLTAGDRILARKMVLAK